MVRQMTVDFLMGENTVVLEEEEGKGTEDEGDEGGSEDMKKMLQTLDVTSLQKGLDAMKKMLDHTLRRSSCPVLGGENPGACNA